MKVCVTGAAGFIGRYVCAELLERGYDVVGIDNFSRYGDVASHTSLQAGNHAIQIVDVDCKASHRVSECLFDCSYLIHGAAKIGGIEYFHRFQFDLLAENERIMAAVCDAAIAHKSTLKRVVYISSSMVFESTNMWPSSEGDELEVPPPRSSYGFQKLAVEFWAKAAWDQYRLPYTIVRPFNCVGVGEDAYMAHVVPDLIRKVMDGQDPLHILGDGYQIRHYTYGGDIARGIVDAMEHPDALCQSFNISSSQSTTVLDLARLIWAKLNPHKGFRYVSERPFEHDVACRIPDVTKAEQVLGFKAETSLSEMLDIVIDYMKQ